MGAIGGMWFPDGKRIAFYTNIGTDGKQINDQFGALFTMNIETKQIQKVRDLDFPAMDGIKLSKDGKYFYLSKNPGYGGSIIVLWPVDDPTKEIRVTESVKNWLGYSNDTRPDWWQGN